jgi:hypothetical protein
LLGHVVELSKTHDAQNKFEHATQEILLSVEFSDCARKRCTYPRNYGLTAPNPICYVFEPFTERNYLSKEFTMGKLDTAVTIHPYFKIQDGQMDACKSFIAQFCELVANEEKCLFYNFTFLGDQMCCREAYEDAEGVQAHLENCGALLGEFLKIADVTRIELQGPAEELEKLKPAFEGFKPDYYVYDCGVGR